MSAPPEPRGLDAVNLPVWASADAVGDFAESQGWTDAGELAAVLALAPTVRGEPMLDLGIGGGRTTTWSRLLTDDYVGVDITPAMVAAARGRHPEADLRVGDARDLSAFADARFGFVMFSFNGIDAVGHTDRAVVLREIARVLRPGGRVLLSTNNRDSPGFASTPWRRRKAPADDASGAGRMAPADGGPADAVVPEVVRSDADPSRAAHARRDRLEFLTHRALRLAADPLLPLRRANSWRRLRRQGEDHGAWAIAPLDAHAFGLLVHWTTLAHARTELGQAGLALRQVFRCDNGRLVGAADWSRPQAVRCDYLHLVAERLATGD